MSGFDIVPDRALLRVSGPQRLTFLDGLLTAPVADLPAGALRYGALLTPQGKLVSDMMIFGEADSVALDVPASALADLMRRLSMYKLRADVELKEGSEQPAVGAAGTPGAVDDPRHPSLGARALIASDPAISDGAGSDRAGSGGAGSSLARGGGAALGEYTEARIAAGVPDSVVDFRLGEAFPHDANMDLTGGVDFAKGCFVGQEVVSRMKHRGTARRRTVKVDALGEALPATGTSILAGETPIGTLGTVMGDKGLAVVRIDRTGQGPLSADGVILALSTPPGAPFALAEAS